MKFLKYYENITDELEVGDYILLHLDIRTSYSGDDMIYKNFINTTIGKICRLHKYNGINILYEKVPDIIRSYFVNNGDSYERNFNFNSIFEYGKTIEELKLKIEAKKFNI